MDYFDLAELSDDELIRWFNAQDPCDRDGWTLADELADEIERRGLDL